MPLFSAQARGVAATFTLEPAPDGLPFPLARKRDPARFPAIRTDLAVSRLVLFLSLFLALGLIAAPAWARPITYQGKLKNAGLMAPRELPVGATAAEVFTFLSYSDLSADSGNQMLAIGARIQHTVPGPQ
jgi:hypothetical protein